MKRLYNLHKTASEQNTEQEHLSDRLAAVNERANNASSSLLDYKRIRSENNLYNKKIIVTKNVIEIITYDNIQNDNHKKQGGGLRDSKSKNMTEDEKRFHDADQLLKSERRAKKKIRQLINANIDTQGKEKAKFYTQTFSDLITDLKVANREFSKGIMKLTYHVRKILKDDHYKLEYIAVPAFQKRGAIHYHVLFFNLPFVPMKILRQSWNHGFLWINALDDISNVGAYVTGYMNQQICDNRFFNEKRFFRSKGLREPQEEKILSSEEIQANDEWECVFEMAYENEYRGKIHYQQFQRKDRPKRKRKKKH